MSGNECRSFNQRPWNLIKARAVRTGEHAEARRRYGVITAVTAALPPRWCSNNVCISAPSPRKALEMNET